MSADLTGFPVACTDLGVAMGRLLMQHLGLQALPDTQITLSSVSVTDLLNTVHLADAIYRGITAPAAHLLTLDLPVALDVSPAGTI